MTIELGQIATIVTVLAGIIGGIWKFHTFSKKQAEKEVNTHNKIDNLIGQNNQIKTDMEKHSDKTERIESDHAKAMEKLEERLQHRIEKLDEKHVANYEKGISEVKDMVNVTNQKVDRLIEIMLKKGEAK